MSLPETYKAILVGEKGEPLIKELPIPKPSTNQVLVRIEDAPINPTDLLKLYGLYRGPADKDPNLNGSEGAGIVVAVGDGLKVPHKVGDRVHVTYGSWGQYLLADSETVSAILQDDLSFEQASAHWVNPGAVYLMGLKAEKGNHKAAIHTVASSALGRMLIRYFKHKGIRLINLVRRDEYIEELKKEGADYVLNSQWPDFEEQLKEIAAKENATIAFDAIGGNFTNTVIKCQPPNSACLIYGALSGTELNGINILELLHEKTIGTVHLFGYYNELVKKNELQSFFGNIHTFLPTLLKSHIQKIFMLEEIKEALAHYNENSSKGKILLKLN